MRLMTLKNKFIGGIDKNADILMTISALLGLGVTTYLMYKAAPDIQYTIRNAKAELEDIEDRATQENWYADERKAAKTEVVVETAKTLAPIVAPPLVGVIFTGGMIIGNNVRWRGREAILVSAVNGANLAAQEFKDIAKEHVGEKKVAEIEEKVSRKHLEESPPIEQGVILITGHGDKLYSILKRPYDETTRVYFRASPEWVLLAIGEANNELSCGGSGGSEMSDGAYLTYSDFLDFIDRHLYDDYARNWVFIKDNSPGSTHRRIEPRLKSHIHPYLKEACCDITFDPGDWVL